MKKTWALSLVITITAIVGLACGGDAATPTTRPPTATSPAPTATTPAMIDPTATSPAMVDPTATAPASTGGGDGDAVLGQQLYLSKGCVGCHSVDGSIVMGPSWKGVYGTTEQLEGGATVTVDEAYLEESILTPSAKIVRGFPVPMPIIPVTDDELQAIIAYIKSLQ